MPNILNFSKILLSHLINHFLKTIFFLSHINICQWSPEERSTWFI